MSSTHLAFLRNLFSPTRGGTPRRRDVSEAGDYCARTCFPGRSAQSFWSSTAAFRTFPNHSINMPLDIRSFFGGKGDRVSKELPTNSKDGVRVVSSSQATLLDIISAYILQIYPQRFYFVSLRYHGILTN